LKILLVEDNAVNRKVTLNQLKNLGYTANVAANGQEAIQMMEQIAYDLVLMDCQMPILDGYQTTQEIRQRQVASQHPIIIALTANALKEDRERCLNAGMDDYLSKPILKQDLADRLAYWSQVILTSTQHSSDYAIPQTMIRSNIHDDNYPCVDLALNWEHLHAICDGNEEFEFKLLQVFVEDAQMHLVNIASAIATGNLPALKQEAHYLKGASANIGLVTVQAIAGKLEQQAHRQQLEGTVTLQTELQESLNQVQTFLTQRNGANLRC
jgi:CheY-like chemotaxis protein